MKCLTKVLSDRKLTLFEDGRIYSWSSLTGSPKRKGRWLKSSKNNAGYFNTTVCISGKVFNFPKHRVIAEVMLKDFSDDFHVDHINGDKTDNRVENLRVVSHRLNMRGFQPKRLSCKSKYRGVTQHTRGGGWKSTVTTLCGKALHLGTFRSQEDAARAFDEQAPNHGYHESALNRTNFHAINNNNQ